MTHDPTKRPRGKPFARGNPGRPPGAKNHRTRVTERLSIEQENALHALGYQLAMEGELQMLKYFLNRTLPKDRCIRIDLTPYQIDLSPGGILPTEAADVIAATLQAVCSGEITPAEGAHVAAVANQYTHALDIADIVKRLDTIEAKNKK
jgi:hypothetical protein